MRCWTLLGLALSLSGCTVVGHAQLGAEFQPRDAPPGLTVQDRRSVPAIELSGISTFPGQHRVETVPVVAEATRAVLGHYLQDLAPGDTVELSILRVSCSLAHHLAIADAAFDLQVEAQFTVRGQTHVKTLAAGKRDEGLNAGWGLDPQVVCPKYFALALQDVGEQAQAFHQRIRR